MKARWRVGALLGRLAYALSRYRFLAMRLDVWLLLALALALSWLAWRAGRQGFTFGQAAILLAGALAWGGLWYVRRRGYAFFQPLPLPEGVRVSGLAAEERLRLWGTGLFEVSEMRRRFVGLPAALWRTELGEYVLMAQHRVRALPFLDRVDEEQGMWYVFFRPEDIREVKTGRWGFGLAQRWAVRLRYRSAGVEKPAELDLAGEGPEVIQRLVVELDRRLVAGTHG